MRDLTRSWHLDSGVCASPRQSAPLLCQKERKKTHNPRGWRRTGSGRSEFFIPVGDSGALLLFCLPSHNAEPQPLLRPASEQAGHRAYQIRAVAAPLSTPLCRRRSTAWRLFRRRGVEPAAALGRLCRLVDRRPRRRPDRALVGAAAQRRPHNRDGRSRQRASLARRGGGAAITELCPLDPIRGFGGWTAGPRASPAAS